MEWSARAFAILASYFLAGIPIAGVVLASIVPLGCLRFMYAAFGRG